MRCTLLHMFTVAGLAAPAAAQDVNAIEERIRVRAIEIFAHFQSNANLGCSDNLSDLANGASRVAEASRKLQDAAADADDEEALADVEDAARNLKRAIGELPSCAGGATGEAGMVMVAAYRRATREIIAELLTQ